jgi:alpha-dystroglycan beta1,4-xylosyltransferase
LKLNVTELRGNQVHLIKTVLRFSFRLYTGPGIVPRSMLTDTGNVVLILNGREPAKISTSVRWLDHVAQRSQQFRNVVVVMLGNERCNNTWLSKYMVNAGGPIKAVFVTYDSPEIDNQYVFQWPLGVAT